MPPGDGFTAHQADLIDEALADAQGRTGFQFAVHVGDSQGDGDGLARALHAALPDPPRSVLMHVDPDGRVLKIVTGTEVRARVPDHAAALTATGMSSFFAGGNLAGGIAHGLRMLADCAESR